MVWGWQGVSGCDTATWGELRTPGETSSSVSGLQPLNRLGGYVQPGGTVPTHPR